MTRTAPLFHGIGPYNLPGLADVPYLAALPPGKAPVSGLMRITQASATPLKWATLAHNWLLAEKAAGRMTAVLSYWPDVDVGGGVMQPLDVDVAAGKWDLYFILLAAAIADYGGKVYFTLRSECNGSWSTGQSVPFVYVQMFRRVAGIMAAYGGGHALMTWHVHPMGSDPWATGLSGLNPWACKLYPGDKYVDAIGLSIYDPAVITPGAPYYKITDAICAQAAARGKPVIFGETSCAVPGVTSPKAISAFFEPWAQFLDDHPIVSAFCYHNQDWTTGQGFSGWQDGRLLTNPDVFAWWLSFLDRPYVVSQ